MLGLSSTLVGYLRAQVERVRPPMIAALDRRRRDGRCPQRSAHSAARAAIDRGDHRDPDAVRGLRGDDPARQLGYEFPTYLTKIGIIPIPHTQIAYSVGIFLLLAIVYAVVLHATSIGRSIFAIRFTAGGGVLLGIRVNRIKFLLYVLSGVVCGLRRRAADLPSVKHQVDDSRASSRMLWRSSCPVVSPSREAGARILAVGCWRQL